MLSTKTLFSLRGSLCVCSLLCILSGPLYGQEPGTSVREDLPMSQPFITDVQEHKETLPLVAASTDSIVRTTTKYYHTYIDTVRVIRYSKDSTERMDTIVTYADSTDRRGHYVQAYVGAGYGTIGFGIDPDHGGKVTGHVTGRLQAQYAYFFHPNWGVGAGLWLENLTSVASLSNGMAYTDFVYLDRVDTDNEPEYNHTARVYGWRERSTLVNMSIPVSVQTQWWNDEGDVGFFGALGLAPTFAVSQKYRLLEADVEHYGVYPKWGLTLDGMKDHEYARNTDQPDLYTTKPTAQGKMNVHTMATLFVDAGILVNMSKQLDMLIGVYGHVAPNNVVDYTSDNVPATVDDPNAPPFGWREDQRVGPSTFMDQYEGLYATSLRVGKTHPWAVGLKVGLHWHHFDKPKTHIEQAYDYFVRADTTLRMVDRLETNVVEHLDTFKRAPKVEIKLIQKKVDKLNKIYFAFDSYVLNAKSKKYLRDIYGLLKGLPNHIIIGGHASEEGNVDHNEQLALNRANAVKKYLVSLGIPEAQLEVRNYGSRVANEENLYKELSLDRRVEIIIME